MIIAIDILPSVEYIYKVNQLLPYANMEATDMDVQIVSKSIYAAQIIRVLQGEPTFVGMLGGFAGRYMKNHMDKVKVKSDIVWIDGETPHQLIVNDQKELHDQTTISIQSSPLNEKDIVKIEQKIKTYIKRATTFVFEAKDLQYISPSIYGDWTEELKKYNIKTILCTDQKEVLHVATQKVPYALMFTVEQLNQLEIDTTSVESIVQQLAAYLGKGVHYIGVDLQNKGGLLLSKNKLCYMEPIMQEELPLIEVSSAAFLGALVTGIDRKYEQEKIAKLAMGAALAVQKENVICNKNDIDLFVKKVKVRELPKTLLSPIQNKYLRLRMKKSTL